MPNARPPAPPAPATARDAFAAELRAGRRTLAVHDALSRAACCEEHADDCARQARADLARAERYARDGVPRDARRLALCARSAERSAAVWRDRAAAHLAEYRTRHDCASRAGAVARRAA